jgi:hypothetical protein
VSDSDSVPITGNASRMFQIVNLAMTLHRFSSSFLSRHLAPGNVARS